MGSSDNDMEPVDSDECVHAPGSPSSDHNSWSSADTARAAPEGSPGGADSADGQRRPKRCKISREQLNILIKSFDEEPLPNFDQRQALAKVLGMTPRSVQIWFQNRRQRLKPMQPKSSAGMGDMGSSSQLPFGRRTPGAAGAAGQASFGMPGLAAVAGLCNGYSSDLMSKAMAQLPLNQGGSGLGSFMHSMNGLPYDVMEPFAATKALLGAGYQPPASLALSQRLAQQAAQAASPGGMSGGSPAAMSPSLHARGTPGACLGPGCSAVAWEPPTPPQQQQQQQQQQPTAQQPGAPPAGKAPAAPQADGLLLLLACAGDSSTPAVAPTPSTAEVVAA